MSGAIKNDHDDDQNYKYLYGSVCAGNHSVNCCLFGQSLKYQINLDGRQRAKRKKERNATKEMRREKVISDFYSLCNDCELENEKKRRQSERNCERGRKREKVIRPFNSFLINTSSHFVAFIRLLM